MGISIQVPNYVNRLTDSHEECSDLLDFTTDKDNWLDFYRRTHSNWPFKADLKSLRSDSHLFRKSPWLGRDTARSKSNKTGRYIQLKFLRRGDNEYVNAWFLHHALDCMLPGFSIDQNLKRLEERTEVCPELEAVKDFTKDNSEQILHDCRQQISREKRLP